MRPYDAYGLAASTKLSGSITIRQGVVLRLQGPGQKGRADWLGAR
eukprot:CAMPEP_0175810922 /NCGR_PEP_ID=MMETSP0107_2-20121207/3581_1 /TAXON_ID=195067 ORGANISM="Goniomonas pacifica, Strain CCMP1869" /NCGR_SAMPLE_ID=MMETSP0107_2 /ASSEMBLY_ACC=CAM_ASM_000203 /LENGTH=44 /DNA_ID= /DNA_START= /DNA_END= /DNA_ORIENTATION=